MLLLAVGDLLLPISRSQAAPAPQTISAACATDGWQSANGSSSSGAARDDQANPAALFARGVAQLQAGDTSAAITLLEKALAQAPTEPLYRLKLAEAYRAAQRWSDVVKTLEPLDSTWNAEGALVLAEAHRRTGAMTRSAEVLRRALERYPRREDVWLAFIDTALEQKQYGLALQRVAEAERQLKPSPQVQRRAAEAYLGLGQVLGATRVRRVPAGRAGQFVDDWLLAEPRDGPERFLCCPPASALYQIRRALDAGLDDPAVHLLHARIWWCAGRPQTAFAILQSREAVLLERLDLEALETFSRLALETDALDDFLRYARVRACGTPERRDEFLAAAYTAVAERYNQRGDETLHLHFLRRALELRPADTALTLRLADAEWTAGHGAEAVQLYRRVLELEATHADRSRILERLAAWHDAERATP